LPAKELSLVKELKRRLPAKTNVEVIRRGLTLLKAATDREILRRAYREASKATRASLEKELSELDHLSSEGLEE